jgi:putative oxidoreductase
MKNLIAKWQSLSPYIQGLLRIFAAFMFTTAGTMKLFAFPVGIPPNNGTVELFSQMGLAGILETFGGLLLLVGLYTRPVAFILAGEMAVAYFQAHFPQNFLPIINGGQPAILYCFIWLYLSAAGAGALSVDSLLKKRAAANQH